jgi:hypothetical protein
MFQWWRDPVIVFVGLFLLCLLAAFAMYKGTHAVIQSTRWRIGGSGALFLILLGFSWKSLEPFLTLPETIKVDTQVVRAVTSIRDSIPAHDVIFVRAFHAIEFVNGEATEWTHDPLDGLGQLMRRVPIRFPFGGSTKWGRIPDSAYIKLLWQTDSEVEKERPGWSKQVSREKLHEYIARLAPHLAPGGRAPVLIDINEVPADREVASEFWRQALSLWLWPPTAPPEQRFALGPFYDCRGRTEEVAGDGTPMPGANMGAVIAVGVTFDKATGKFRINDFRKRFSQYGDRVENHSSSPMYVRLLMNDDIPEDNSQRGECLVRYREFSF